MNLSMPSSDVPLTSSSAHYPSDFLSKLTLEHHPRSRRRASTGDGSDGKLLSRGSSVARLFPIKGMGSSWGENSFGSFKGGNESATDITLSNSLASMEENEFASLALIKDLDQAITDLTKRKTKLEHKIDNIHELACARYEGGSEMGAILSMRKAHRNRSRKAYIAAARFQLVEMRKQIETEMNQGNFASLDVCILRNRALDVVAKINSADCPTPSNEELLQQLYKVMHMAEI